MHDYLALLVFINNFFCRTFWVHVIHDDYLKSKKIPAEYLTKRTPKRISHYQPGSNMFDCFRHATKKIVRKEGTGHTQLAIHGPHTAACLLLRQTRRWELWYPRKLSSGDSDGSSPAVHTAYATPPQNLASRAHRGQILLMKAMRPVGLGV